MSETFIALTGTVHAIRAIVSKQTARTIVRTMCGRQLFGDITSGSDVNCQHCNTVIAAIAASHKVDKII